METIDRVRRQTAAAFILAVVTAAAGCGADEPLGLADSSDGLLSLTSGPAAQPKTTGGLEIIWPGGRGRVIPPGEEKLAFADFNAFPATTAKPARGEFIYRVLNADSTPHREIVASVTDAVVDVAQNKAWFAGLVISDVKICSGGSCDGDDGCSHDDGGCGDDGGHDDGGCSGGGSGGSGGIGGSDGGCSDGSHDDGGCTDGGSDGGCSDGSHDDGGCTDGGSDGGCNDGGHDDGGCAGGGGGSDGGHGGPGGIPGKDPRVGQVVLVKVHDVGTPGTNGDGITWKWFASGTQLDLLEEPRHLCKKDIIGGNLVVHPVPGS